MTPAALRSATGCSRTAAAAWADPVSKAIAEFGISNVAEFVAQCAHESAGFTSTSEDLFYTSASRILAMWPSRFTDADEAERFVRNPSALANRVYANRLGNGEENSGDGWSYRGRGLIQITGRTHYLAYEEGTGVPAIQSPDLLAGQYAAHSAAWWWVANGLNGKTDVRAITRAVNGRAMVGLGERVALTEMARSVLA